MPTRYEGRIEAGVWELAPRVFVTMTRSKIQAGRWHGTATLDRDIARAMERAREGSSPLRFRTGRGPSFVIAITRWWPIGRDAAIEFTALAEKPRAAPRVRRRWHLAHLV